MKYDGILLLTLDIHDPSMGGMYMRDLTAHTGGQRFKFVRLYPFLSTIGSSHAGRIWLALFKLLCLVPLFHNLRLAIFSHFMLAKTVNQLKVTATELGVERFWVTATSPEVILISNRLVEGGFDVWVTICDSPEYLAANLGLRGSVLAKVRDAFSNLMTHCKKASVVSMAMRDKYHSSFGSECVVVRPAVYKAFLNRREYERTDIRIVFSGSLYSKTEWNCLIAALDSVEWKIFDLDVSLYFIGRFPRRGAHVSQRVVLLGQMSYDDTIDTMRDFDIGYLPYWFSKKYADVAETSFPGKFSAYTSAGLAVFNHSPSYTEISTFLDRFNYGVNCASLAPDSIISHLGELTQRLSASNLRDAQLSAVSEELSIFGYDQRLEEFLYCPRVDLP